MEQKNITEELRKELPWNTEDGKQAVLDNYKRLVSTACFYHTQISYLSQRVELGEVVPEETIVSRIEKFSCCLQLMLECRKELGDTDAKETDIGICSDISFADKGELRKGKLKGFSEKDYDKVFDWIMQFSEAEQKGKIGRKEFFRYELCTYIISCMYGKEGVCGG